MSPELLLIVGELSRAVKRDAQLIALYQSKLLGPLLATVSKESIQKAKMAKMQSKKVKNLTGFNANLDNLVKQVNIGVGEYTIEILSI
jgi:hypothetical protein